MDDPSFDDEDSVAFKGGSFNLDELLARSKMGLRVVLKYYFQWAVLLYFHFMLVFYLPITGNEKYTKTAYCPPPDLTDTSEDIV